jgi:hypothetical protein
MVLGPIGQRGHRACARKDILLAKNAGAAFRDYLDIKCIDKSLTVEAPQHNIGTSPWWPLASYLGVLKHME